MKKLTLALHVVGMTVLGIAALSVPGILYEAREGQPVVSEPLRSLASQEADLLKDDVKQLHALGYGLLVSMRVAETELASGDRGKAMHALDAAMRVSKVGEHAAEEGTAFKQAHQKIMNVRQAVQRGNTKKAISTLDQAARNVKTHLNEGLGAVSDNNLPDLKDLPGATVMNVQGVRIGEVIDAQPGLQPQITVSLGGIRDFLGFIDLSGGEVRTFSSDELIFGKHQTIGGTFVVASRATPLPSQ